VIEINFIIIIGANFVENVSTPMSDTLESYIWRTVSVFLRDKGIRNNEKARGLANGRI